MKNKYIEVMKNRKLKVQKRIARILSGKFVHYFVLTFILCSISAVIASSYEEMRPYRFILFCVMYASSFVFLVEYVARIFSAPAVYPHLNPVKARLKYSFSFYGFVDFVAVIPCVVIYFYEASPLVHAIILPYIFITFKLIRHSKSFRLIGKALVQVKEELITAYSACLIMVSFSGILMYFIERQAQPEIFRNIGDGFWWAIVTFTTTGYGDIYPVTALGKLLGSIISLIGIAMIAIPTGIISSSFMRIIQTRDRNEGNNG